MARPRKSRSLEGEPRPVIYIPSGWTRNQTAPVEVAIEDFEVMRLVDGHANSIEEAADRVGVARSTAGRMLERARRAIAIGIEQQAPVYLDALESSLLLFREAPETREQPGLPPGTPRTIAVAVQKPDMASRISRIFGRTPAFALHREGRNPEFIDNPGMRSGRNSADKAVALLRQNGVGRVVSGRFGPDALEKLGKAGIQPLIAIGVTLEEAFKLFT